MPAVMDNLTIVQDILDRMLPTADLQPLLDHLADDVALTVAAPHGGSADTQEGRGKAAVLDYFATLGDLLTFWRVKYSWSGGRVVVMAEERFTIQPGGLAAQSELALIFDLRDGLITRLLVVEDPPAWEPGPGVAAELQEDLCRAGCRPPAAGGARPRWWAATAER
jgi:ketosteroid isomerase-like protein